MKRKKKSNKLTQPRSKENCTNERQKVCNDSLSILTSFTGSHMARDALERV